MVLFPPLLLGVVCVGVGALLIVRRERMARLHIRLEAIGARRWSTLDPAGWYVAATALVGAGFVALGLWAVLFAFAPELAGALVP